MSAKFQITGSTVKIVNGKPEIVLNLKVKDGYKVTYTHNGNTYSLNAGVSTITIDGFNDTTQQEIRFTVTNKADAVDTSEISYTVNDDGSYTLTGTDDDDTLEGGDGDDTIDAGAGDDKIDGGAGNDKIDAGAGDDKIDGGAGNDDIDGGDGNDDIRGGDGNDTLRGGDNAEATLDPNDNYWARWGFELLYGGDGNDRLYGSDGEDMLSGGAGNDILQGGRGDDIIYGGAGDDIIDGMRGNNTLWGGAGNDFFVLLGGARGSADHINDFELGKDKIVLADADDFASLTIEEEPTYDHRESVVTITYGSSELMIYGIEASDLSASDFVS